LSVTLTGCSPVVKNESNDSTSAASSQTIKTWEDALQAIDYALDRLHFLGGEIRKASAKRLEYNVASYLTEEDALFRKYAAGIVKRNFPDARPSLHEQLADTIAVRRKFMKRKHHHATKLAGGQDPQANKSPERNVDNPAEPQLQVTGHGRALQAPQSAVTKASKPNVQELLKQIHKPTAPIRPILQSTISSMSSVHGDSIDYPECPQVKDNEKHVQCPYCLKGLPVAELRGQKKDNYWR
jgi:hypothetical protein